MANPVIMPRQGQSVESCVITSFNKKVGDHVNIGDIVFSYETDKAAFDEEATAEGTLLAVFFNEGDDVPCLETVCVIGNEGEDVSAYKNQPQQNQPQPGVIPPEAQEAIVGAISDMLEILEPVSAEVWERLDGPDSTPRISPRARRAAEQMRVNPGYANGTGPDGRIIERDILELAASGAASTYAATPAYMQDGASAPRGTGLGGRYSTADIVIPGVAQAIEAVKETAEKLIVTPTEPAYYEEPLSNMRKIIAKSMHSSLSGMAQLTHNASFDATDILALRKSFKENGEELGLSQITLNDILLYAVSRTLAMPEHRAMNAHLVDDKMRYFNAVHLGVAVDTPRGLMVPTLSNADTKSLSEISAEAKTLAKACVAGNVSPDALQGGTFTVSNLGALEIESFTPVINPPQTGILGVNTIVYRPREDGSVYPAMTLSLTYDHRAVDGAPASRFLRDLKRRLERFSLLLALG